MQRASKLGAMSVAVIVCAGSIGGCNKTASSAPGAADHGRYAGVGIYTPSTPWTKLVVAAASDPSSAKLPDDQAIIVTVDSVTGEIRACGDLSGYCVDMNPWRAGLAKSQTAPVSLTEHRTSNVEGPAATNAADNEAAPATEK
jgi:hypothetical protein